eukprot:6214186-Pleurochrysis_carterae.AAC.1
MLLSPHWVEVYASQAVVRLEAHPPRTTPFSERTGTVGAGDYSGLVADPQPLIMWALWPTTGRGEATATNATPLLGRRRSTGDGTSTL